MLEQWYFIVKIFANKVNMCVPGEESSNNSLSESKDTKFLISLELPFGPKMSDSNTKG